MTLGSKDNQVNMNILRGICVHSSFLLQPSFSPGLSIFLITGTFQSVIYLISSLSVIRALTPTFDILNILMSLQTSKYLIK